MKLDFVRVDGCSDDGIPAAVQCCVCCHISISDGSTVESQVLTLLQVIFSPAIVLELMSAAVIS